MSTVLLYNFDVCTTDRFQDQLLSRQEIELRCRHWAFDGDDARRGGRYKCGKYGKMWQVQSRWHQNIRW